MATTECSSDGSKDEQGMADTYVVQRGDTLAGVALRLGVKQSELKRANHMYGSASLITGQSLKLDGIHQRKPAPTSPTEEVGTPSAHSPSSVKIETDSGTARRSLSGAGEGDQTEEEEELIAEPLPEEEEIWLAQDSQSVGTAEFPGGAVDVSPVGGSLSRTRQDDDDCKPNDIELLYAPPHWGEETWGDANEGGVMLDSPLRAASPPLEPEPNMPKPLKLPGLVTEASTIVTHSTLARLEAALPKHYRGYNWYLLYSTFRDGASYLQLYSRVKAEEPTYVLVENMKGEVFGGFATSAWSSGCQYYGTGECFLFKILGRRLPSVSNGTTTPAAEGHAWEAGQEEEGRRANKALLEGEITAYPWTGMNTYLQFSDDVGIGMGGGGANGSFGLFIGEDFLDGSTGTCDTFSNPPLCSSEHFEISQFEVWGFTTADSEMGARLERLRKTLRGRTTRPL